MWTRAEGDMLADIWPVQDELVRLRKDGFIAVGGSNNGVNHFATRYGDACDGHIFAGKAFIGEFHRAIVSQ